MASRSTTIGINENRSPCLENSPLNEKKVCNTERLINEDTKNQSNNEQKTMDYSVNYMK